MTDIKPGNVCYDSKSEKLTLIDFQQEGDDRTSYNLDLCLFNFEGTEPSPEIKHKDETFKLQLINDSTQDGRKLLGLMLLLMKQTRYEEIGGYSVNEIIESLSKDISKTKISAMYEKIIA